MILHVYGGGWRPRARFASRFCFALRFALRVALGSIMSIPICLYVYLAVVACQAESSDGSALRDDGGQSRSPSLLLT